MINRQRFLNDGDKYISRNGNPDLRLDRILRSSIECFYAKVLFESLKKEVINPKRHPDVGELKLHPSAGATVIGARKFLIAFNVNVGTSDLQVAQTIARAVRAAADSAM